MSFEPISSRNATLIRCDSAFIVKQMLEAKPKTLDMGCGTAILAFFSRMKGAQTN